MRFNQFFAALMVLAAMVIPAVADEVDDLILDLKYGTEVVRNDAARILGEIGDQRAVDPLIDALEDENEIWIIRELAAMALGEIGDPKAIDPLIDALNDENPYVRGTAAEALGEIGDPKAIDPLIDALNDEQHFVRSGAAEALGEISDQRAVDPLIEALKDDDWDIQLWAASSLVKLGKTDYLDLVLLALEDEKDHIRFNAAEALGWIGDPRAVDPLIEVLWDEDEDSFVRKNVALALGEIGDPRAINPLIDALKDEESLVRTAAAEALDMMVGVAECQLDSYTPDQTAFVGQPGDVFPLRNSPFKAGSYIVLVGPAGEDGLDLPPATWNAFGPYELKGGHKYKAMIESPLGESLRFEEDLADLLSYSDPSPESASVYARNNCPGDVWYAICLRPTKLEGGTAAETEDEWIDDECLQMGEPFDACQCLYIKAKDLIKAGEYDKAIQLLNYIIEVVTPIHNDRVAQGFPFSNSAQQLVANSWFFKGDALSQQGRYGEAIQAYDEAIELDPGSWSDPLNPPKYYLYWVAKGDALENLGRNSEAQQCFDESDRIKQAWGWE